MPDRPSIVLFFTSGNSLALWERAGIFSREVTLYQKLQELGVDSSFLTYGGGAELDFQARIPGIKILCNRRRLPAPLYTRLMCRLHRRELAAAGLYKTNQLHGAQYALRAARRFGKPLIVRCGYLLSHKQRNAFGADSRHYRFALKLEDRAFHGAERILLTAEEMRRDVLARFPELARKIIVQPNYVDTELFRPDWENRRPCKLIFVGRLTRQKNLFELIAAVRDSAAVELELIGAGDQEDDLKRCAAECPRIQFTRPLEHRELPARLNGAGIFVLPSLWEGHPKALIEALACGMPVIGANVDGIRGLLEHEKTGLLCEPKAASIRAAIETLTADADLQRRLGTAARAFAVEQFSLDRIARREAEIYRSLLVDRQT